MQSPHQAVSHMVATPSVHKDCKDCEIGLKTEHLRAGNYPENTNECPILILVDRHSYQGRVAQKWGPRWYPPTGVGTRIARQVYPQNEHRKM